MAAGMGVMEYPDELKNQNTQVSACRVQATILVGVLRSPAVEGAEEVGGSDVRAVLSIAVLVLCRTFACSLAFVRTHALYPTLRTQQNRTDVTHKYSPGLLPFWHFDCGVDPGVALTSWLSIVISQLCLILLIFKIVASTAHAWVCLE